MQAGQGSTSALWEIVKRFQPIVGQLVRKETRLCPYADDLVQDAALLIRDLLRRYDPSRAKVRTLLDRYLPARLLQYGRDRYLGINRRGNGNRYTCLPEDKWDDLIREEQDNPYEAVVTHIALEQIVSRLTPGQREAVEMVVIEGMTQVEAYRASGITSASMCVRLARAMRHVAVALEYK